MDAAAAIHFDKPVIFQRAISCNGDAAVDPERSLLGNGERALIYVESKPFRNGEAVGERAVAGDAELALAVGNSVAQLLFDGKGRSFDGHGLFAVNFGAVVRRGSDGDLTGGVTGGKIAVNIDLRQPFAGDDRPLHRRLPCIIRKNFHIVLRAAAGLHAVRAGDRDLFGQHALLLVQDAVRRQHSVLKYPNFSAFIRSADFECSVHKDRSVVRNGIRCGNRQLHTGFDIDLHFVRNSDRTVERDIRRHIHSVRRPERCFHLVRRRHVRKQIEVPVVYERAGAVPAFDRNIDPSGVFNRTGYGYLHGIL